MGLNFRKSITLTKGVKLNLSKGGVSLSFGTKGVRQSISTSGRSTTTLSVPGTGIYYTKSKKVSDGIGGLLKTDKKKTKAKSTTKKSTAKSTATKKSAK